MKITKHQIQELYKFTWAHYVEHYDLQMELVDHLANGIEQHWRQDPDLGFKEALNREFKKFGVFGFQEVITKRRKAMAKRYRVIIWSYFKEWWSFPKIMGTLAAFTLVFTVLRLFPQGDLKFGTVAGIFLAFSLMMLYRAVQLKQKKKGTWRKWMLQEMIYEQGTAVQLFLLPMHFWNLQWANDHMDNLLVQAILAVLIVVMALLLKICGYVIPSKAEELLLETYPEYRMS